MLGITVVMNQGSQFIQICGPEFHKKKQERKPAQTDQRVILNDTSWAHGMTRSRASNSVNLQKQKEGNLKKKILFI